MVYVLDLKLNFEVQYAIEVREGYKLDKLELRDPIEWYYVIQAKHGRFCPSAGEPMAFYCTSKRIKENILKKYQVKVTLFLDYEDKPILLFNKDMFLEIASIAKARKKRGERFFLKSRKPD